LTFDCRVPDVDGGAVPDPAVAACAAGATPMMNALTAAVSAPASHRVEVDRLSDKRILMFPFQSKIEISSATLHLATCALNPRHGERPSIGDQPNAVGPGKRSLAPVG
jgi:hypothetical protein